MRWTHSETLRLLSSYIATNLQRQKIIRRYLGKNRLTDRSINLLQNYFGMAIRQNSDVPSMKNTISAVLFYCSVSECDEKRHLFGLRPRTAGVNDNQIR